MRDIGFRNLFKVTIMTQHTHTHSSNAGSNAGHRFIDVQKALKGASYPADKRSLLETARANGAERGILDAIDGLPDREYANPAEVSKGVGDET